MNFWHQIVVSLSKFWLSKSKKVKFSNTTWMNKWENLLVSLLENKYWYVNNAACYRILNV